MFKRAVLLTLVLALAVVLSVVVIAQQNPDGFPEPDTVTLAGTIQSVLGCDGDWQPPCEATFMTYDETADLWQASFDLPVGNYEYKIALNGSWDQNYGQDGVAGGPNIPLPVAEAQTVAFTYDHNTGIVTDSVNLALAVAAQFDPGKLRAYWVDTDLILWPDEVTEGDTFTLYTSETASLLPSDAGVANADHAFVLSVDAAGVPEAVAARFPHLADLTALRLGADDAALAKDVLRGQVALAQFDAAGALVSLSGLQIPGVLDALYSYGGPLGPVYMDGTIELRVWAPTAQSVRLLLAEEASSSAEVTAVPMTMDPVTGVWAATGDLSWDGLYYQYEVVVFVPRQGTIETNVVTDPYSVNVFTNGTFSQILSLDDPALKPAGWDELAKPALAAPEDIVLYELHMRDFSALDETVPEAYRGTFKAFTVAGSTGMNHLAALADAGLTHVHLLPVFDIATINENKDRWREPDYAAMAAAAPDSEFQQAQIQPIRDLDAFNWGYDPLHYNTPEGSYSTDPDSPARIIEFREMVQALNQQGLRVVMDVVYNHTNASGQARKAVLDRIVPGYYHRLDRVGNVTTSTCCANTATEHDMMRKLMIDSVLLYATQYQVDGFRFDLMGHHMLTDMQAVRVALDSLTLEEHGVDGKAIYVYGEGWNFGEVADNQRGVNATQLNIGGTGIGVFNDRIRDAIRGGNPFGDYQVQGFINGLYYQPNGITPGTEEEQRQRLLHFGDQIRIGMAGNLRDYAFPGHAGEIVTGADIDYNGAPAGYTLDPQENIVYASAHDNETLFDIIQYKAPLATTPDERVRMQNLALSIVGYSQGVPFFHAGSELLRSKSFDKDSYNSGDWFNRLDYTYQTNNFGVGLPIADKNQAQWGIQQPLLADPALQVGPDQIMAAFVHMQEVLAVRSSSPLFRLATADEITERVQFLNVGPDQVPGMIVMVVSDQTGPDLDPDLDGLVIVINASPEAIAYPVEAFRGAGYTLHPVLAESADDLTRTAAFDATNGTFTVPGRTAVVFVAPQS